MKVFLAAMAAAALSAAPALAQGQQKAPDAAGHPMDMSKMTPEELHKHCSMIMGGKMQGTPKHDHSSDKMGHTPSYKAPTDAEMKAMHEKCAAIMAEPKKN